jgi:hypothetical protein
MVRNAMKKASPATEAAIGLSAHLSDVEVPPEHRSVSCLA